jgi:hypothetical protein
MSQQGRFYSWTGCVEDRNDPLKLGRYRVRILGAHNERTNTKTGQPIADLPWAHCSLPVTSASVGGVSETPNLVEGTWVHGYFQDGKNSQIPIILGTLPGLPQEPKDNDTDFGFKDMTPQYADSTLFDGQQSRDMQPRLLTTRTLNTDGTGSTFKEEGTDNEADKADERQPACDGYRESYERKETYNSEDLDGETVKAIERSQIGGDLSPLAAAYESDSLMTKALADAEKITILDEEQDNKYAGSESILLHKAVTLDKEVPTASAFDDIDEIEFLVADSLKCIEIGGFTGLYDGIKCIDVTPAEGLVAITPSSGGPDQEITSKKSPDDFEESNDDGEWDEPSTQAYTVYPFNQVKETESGHVIEYDDTPGQERIHEFHRTGSFREIHPDGTKVEKIVNDNYTIILKDDHMHVEGNVYLTVDKGAKLFINRDGSETTGDNVEVNDFDIQIGKGGNLNIDVEQGDVVTRLKDGNLISTIDVGSAYTKVAKGNSRLSVDDGKIELIGKEINIETLEDLEINVKGEAKIKVADNCCIDVGGHLNAKVAGNAVLDIRQNLIAHILQETHIHSVAQMTLTSDDRILMVAPTIDLNP